MKPTKKDVLAAIEKLFGPPEIKPVKYVAGMKMNDPFYLFDGDDGFVGPSCAVRPQKDADYSEMLHAELNDAKGG